MKVYNLTRNDVLKTIIKFCCDCEDETLIDLLYLIYPKAAHIEWLTDEYCTEIETDLRINF